jgi:hypothetical protein
LTVAQSEPYDSRKHWANTKGRLAPTEVTLAMAEFFEISTPRQMLEKAQRDFQKLSQNTDTDNVFNFFVTAYHIVDYVKALKTVATDDIEALYEEPDFRRCRYICNKSKHRMLEKGDDEFVTYRRPSAALDEFTLGESALGLGRAYFIIDDTEQVDILDLGQRIISRWEAFFKTHGIG